MSLSSDGSITGVCACEQRRAFNYCPEHFALHTTRQSRCSARTNHGICERLVLPVGSGWNTLGGGPGRRWSAESAREFRPKQGAGLPTPVGQPDQPPPSALVGAVIFAGGRVVYVHGNTLRTYWPDTPSSPMVLKETIPPEPWRLLECNGWIMCAGPSNVSVVDTDSWSVTYSLPGRYEDHIALNAYWVGLRGEGNQIAFDFYSPESAHMDTVMLEDISIRECARIASDGEKVFVASRDAQIWAVSPGGSRYVIAATGAGISQTLSLQVQGDRLLLMRSQDGAVHLDLINPAGAVFATMRLSVSSPYQNIVLTERVAYLLDPSKSKLHSFGSDIRGENEPKQLPGFSSVKWFSGIYKGDRTTLALATLDLNPTKGQVKLIDAGTGASTTFSTIFPDTHVSVIPAGDRLVIATSNLLGNRIAVYEL